MYVTVKQLAALLGMTESGVRNVISRHRIRRRGTGQYRAALYDPADVLRHAGSKDRLAPTTQLVGH